MNHCLVNIDRGVCVSLLVYGVYTYFEPLFFDPTCMVDYFVVILHIRDPVAALLQLTGRHRLDQVHFVGGFHQGRVKLSGDAGESFCK